MGPATPYSVLQALPLPTVVVDREDRVRLWNPAAERLLGWRAEEALGFALVFHALHTEPVVGDALKESHWFELQEWVRAGRPGTS